MKVQRKIIILLFTIISAFLALFFLQKVFEKNRLILLLKDEERHISETFDRIIELKGTPLKTLAYDYSFWDEMVDFVENGGLEWAKENLDVSLSTFSTNTIWVYKTDSTLAYFVSDIEGGETEKLLLSGIQIPELFSKEKFPHFFINSNKGLFEIRCAKIQPTSDSERKTPARGYFFAGKLWGKNINN